MVEVGHKEVTQRKAVAQAIVRMQPETRTQLMQGNLPKGDALQVARVAGVMAAKKTPDLIPLCHPIPISGIDIHLNPLGEDQIQVLAEVRNTAKTGVEMEALTACSITALTLYDMAKAIDPKMEILNICLLEKDGGKNGHWLRDK